MQVLWNIMVNYINFTSPKLFAQRPAGGCEEGAVIIWDDYAAPAWTAVPSPALKSPGPSLRRRKAQRDAGAAAGRVFGRGRPAVLFHQLARYGKAQSDPAGLGGEEGLKDLLPAAVR